MYWLILFVFFFIDLVDGHNISINLATYIMIQNSLLSTSNYFEIPSNIIWLLLIVLNLYKNFSKITFIIICSYSKEHAQNTDHYCTKGNRRVVWWYSQRDIEWSCSWTRKFRNTTIEGSYSTPLLWKLQRIPRSMLQTVLIKSLWLSRNI